MAIRRPLFPTPTTRRVPFRPVELHRGSLALIAAGGAMTMATSALARSTCSGALLFASGEAFAEWSASATPAQKDNASAELGVLIGGA